MNRIEQRIHLLGSLMALACIVTFMGSTLIGEILLNIHSIALIKKGIVIPGLFILIPALMATGITGRRLGATRPGRLTEGKKKRMPFIALNGIFILMPCALFLNIRAGAGNLDALFFTVQALEIIAGGTNIVLMAKNFGEGLKLSGKLSKRRK